MNEDIVAVIGVLNVARTIGGCLDALTAQPCDIVIVDGGSTDGTLEIIEKYRYRVQLISKPGNLSVARDEAIRQTTHEYIAMTDGDTVVSDHWLEELLGGFAPGIGGVGGPSEVPTDTLVDQTLACIPVHGPSRREVPIWGPPKYERPFVAKGVYTVAGRCAMYRRAALETVGGFDERAWWADDSELNQRLIDGGYSLAYEPKATVKHEHPETFGSFFRHQAHYAAGQAIAGRINKRARRRRHPVPLVAFCSFFALLGGGIFWRWLLYPVLAFLVAVLSASLAYGIKCARWKRNWRLVLTVPVGMGLWQLAWVFGYPWGLMANYGKLGR